MNKFLTTALVTLAAFPLAAAPPPVTVSQPRTVLRTPAPVAWGTHVQPPVRTDANQVVLSARVVNGSTTYWGTQRTPPTGATWAVSFGSLPVGVPLTLKVRTWSHEAGFQEVSVPFTYQP